MYIGQNLKTIRKKWGDNQTDFGARFGMSKTLVSKWELGETEPGLQVLIWLEDQTGIPMRTLIEEEIMAEDIGHKPGDLQSKVMEREKNKLKLKISDLVMELEEKDKEKVKLLEAMQLVIDFLEKNMDKSVYEKEKKAYLERVSAILSDRG